MNEHGKITLSSLFACSIDNLCNLKEKMDVDHFSSVENDHISNKDFVDETMRRNAISCISSGIYKALPDVYCESSGAHNINNEIEIEIAFCKQPYEVLTQNDSINNKKHVIPSLSLHRKSFPKNYTIPNSWIGKYNDNKNFTRYFESRRFTDIHNFLSVLFLSSSLSFENSIIEHYDDVDLQELSTLFALTLSYSPSEAQQQREKSDESRMMKSRVFSMTSWDVTWESMVDQIDNSCDAGIYKIRFSNSPSQSQIAVKRLPSDDYVYAFINEYFDLSTMYDRKTMEMDEDVDNGADNGGDDSIKTDDGSTFFIFDRLAHHKVIERKNSSLFPSHAEFSGILSKLNDDSNVSLSQTTSSNNNGKSKNTTKTVAPNTQQANHAHNEKYAPFDFVDSSTPGGCFKSIKKTKTMKPLLIASDKMSSFDLIVSANSECVVQVVEDDQFSISSIGKACEVVRNVKNAKSPSVKKTASANAKKSASSVINDILDNASSSTTLLMLEGEQQQHSMEESSPQEQESDHQKQQQQQHSPLFYDSKFVRLITIDPNAIKSRPSLVTKCRKSFLISVPFIHEENIVGELIWKIDMTLYWRSSAYNWKNLADIAYAYKSFMERLDELSKSSLPHGVLEDLKDDNDILRKEKNVFIPSYEVEMECINIMGLLSINLPNVDNNIDRVSQEIYDSSLFISSLLSFMSQ